QTCQTGHRGTNPDGYPARSCWLEQRQTKCRPHSAQRTAAQPATALRQKTASLLPPGGNDAPGSFGSAFHPLDNIFRNSNGRAYRPCEICACDFLPFYQEKWRKKLVPRASGLGVNNGTSY